jgi:hypothetical protein
VSPDWVSRAVLAAIVVLPILVTLRLRRRGWRSKTRAQRGWSPPMSLPFDLVGHDARQHPWLLPPTRVRFLGTNLAGDWLGRVDVHDLGVASPALVAVDDSGVWLDRQGASSVLISVDDLVDARSDRAVAGRVYQHDGVVAVTWRLGEVSIESGLRIAQPVVQARLVHTVNALGSAVTPGGAS